MLRRYGEWVEGQYLTIATIEKVAKEIKTHARIVRDASADPKGRRVAALVRAIHRLEELVSELQPLPTGLQRHSIE